MIDLERLRKNPKLYAEGARKKGAKVDIDAILEIDSDWRQQLQKLESLRHEQNNLVKQKEVGERAKAVKQEIKELEAQVGHFKTRLEKELEAVPNPSDPDIPEGGEDQNKVIREWDSQRDFGFGPKDYLTIAENLDIIDMERGAKLAGSRFGYLKGKAALLELALIQYAFKKLVAKGFIPVIPPVMIKPEMFRGMGRLFAGQEVERYFIPSDNLYLVGSAEHSLGPMHADEILDEKNLPRRYVGFSTCFRREAGSYGKDTKGILRVHQFDKVEMFSFTKPEESAKELEFLVSLQEEIMRELVIPHRVVLITTGDMGWMDTRQYDLEAWLPGQGKFRETHSASNTGDFQARGVNAKYRKADGKTDHVHMLNATGIAIGRTIIAIAENYQTKEGDFEIPKVLQPLM